MSKPAKPTPRLVAGLDAALAELRAELVGKDDTIASQRESILALNKVAETDARAAADTLNLKNADIAALNARVRDLAGSLAGRDFDNARLTLTVSSLADRLGTLEDYRNQREREDCEREGEAEVAR